MTSQKLLTYVETYQKDWLAIGWQRQVPLSRATLSRAPSLSTPIVSFLGTPGGHSSSSKVIEMQKCGFCATLVVGY